MVIAIISILLVCFSVSIRFLCAASGEIKMFIMKRRICNILPKLTGRLEMDNFIGKYLHYVHLNFTFMQCMLFY